MGPIIAADGLFREHVWMTIQHPDGLYYSLEGASPTYTLVATTLEEAITESEDLMLSNHNSVRVLTQWLVSGGTAKTLFVL